MARSPKKFSSDSDFAASLPPTMDALVGVTLPAPRPMGGMTEGTWSGVPMWTCPRCRGTTFDAQAAAAHTCKEIKLASDATEE